MAGVSRRRHVDRHRDGDAVRGPDPDAREDVRVAHCSSWTSSSAMGARIVLCDPHRVLVAGPTRLRGAARVESPDIRAGMAMLLAALLRRRHEHDQQRRADRARLRAHRRAARRARRAHRAGRRRVRTERRHWRARFDVEDVPGFAASASPPSPRRGQAGSFGAGLRRSRSRRSSARWTRCRTTAARMARRLGDGASGARRGPRACTVRVAGWLRGTDRRRACHAIARHGDGRDGRGLHARSSSPIRGWRGWLLLHAGWRGTAAGILERGFAELGPAWRSDGEVHVHLGPAICGACYEVGPEVIEAVLGARVAGPTLLDVRGEPGGAGRSGRLPVTPA